VNSPLRAYCFIDGGHLRAIARESGKPLPNPRILAQNLVSARLVQRWLKAKPVADYKHHDYEEFIGLARVIYYDGRPEGEIPLALEEYWSNIEILPDTEIGFGSIRGRPRRQKMVDTLIAVDMLVGAFTGLFEVAVLIAGDSDFVPVVQEVRRRGVMVVAVSTPHKLAPDLRRTVDRVWELDPSIGTDFPFLTDSRGAMWHESSTGEISVVLPAQTEA